MDAKENLELQVVTLMRKSLSEDQLNMLQNVLTSVMYNYGVTEIKNTELAIYEGSKTEKLLQYFAMSKLASKKSKNTVSQYIMVAHQLCDMVHKELDEIPIS